MDTKITWLGHGAFEIQTAGMNLLIDPFLTDNPSASTTAKAAKPDVILISHGHGDHVGDAVDIAKRTGALCIANYEIVHWLGLQGIKNTHPLQAGGQRGFDFGTVKLTIAHHGSMLPDGSNGGNPCGILLKLKDGTIYHACDTGLFGDMQLIGEEGIDLAILPIGDNFTMGPDDAVQATKLIKPLRVMPDHYNTWPLIAQDAHAWADHIRAETSAAPQVLEPGGSITL